MSQVPDEAADNQPLREATADDYCSAQLRLGSTAASSAAAVATSGSTYLDAHMTLGYVGSEALAKAPGFRRLSFVGSEGVIELDLLEVTRGKKEWI